MILGAIGYWESTNQDNFHEKLKKKQRSNLMEKCELSENGLKRKKAAAPVKMRIESASVAEAVDQEEEKKKKEEEGDGDGFKIDPDSNSAQDLSSLKLPLSLLKAGKHADVSDLIINRQMGVEDVDPETGWTLIHHLALSYNLSALTWLLSKQIYGPDGVNQRTADHCGGQTALHLALTHTNPLLSMLIADVLLEYGASPDIPDASNRTARQLILEAGPKGGLLAQKMISIFNREYDPRLEVTPNESLFKAAFGTSKPPQDPIFFQRQFSD